MATIRLPDPLTTPGAPGFVSAKMMDNNPVYRDRLPGGKVITLESAAQYWGLVLPYEELLPEQYDIIASKIFLSKSTGNPILVLLPHKENFRVSGDTNSVLIPASQQGSSLVINNYYLTGIPKSGDLFKLTNHCSKVYKILDASLNAGVLTLTLYPNLLKATTGIEKPIFNNILFQVALEDPSKWDSNFSPEGTYTSFQLELAETITYD